MFDCVRMWEKELRGRVKHEQALLEKEQRKNVYVKALEMRKKGINDLKEIEEKEHKLQLADAIRRLVKLCVAAVRLREEIKAVDVVAWTSQTGGVQASIFGTDKTMIVQAKPMWEAAHLADVMALKTALPDLRKNPAAFYEEVEGAINSCTMPLADIDLFFGLIYPPDMWRTVRKVDDREALGRHGKI
ncbi:hypothetical protein NDU88_002551 [Pleurodeles waltl]|uniref:Uncharacterized protein n=1 Tax=Pleurodeles waltl TaxID=8319 RepID=A0AAV7M1U4_PLEWA|nr:hypothetical protein NDU88_002551 [Pleurodeles waltl]